MISSTPNSLSFVSSKILRREATLFLKLSIYLAFSSSEIILLSIRVPNIKAPSSIFCLSILSKISKDFSELSKINFWI